MILFWESEKWTQISNPAGIQNQDFLNSQALLQLSHLDPWQRSRRQATQAALPRSFRLEFFFFLWVFFPLSRNNSFSFSPAHRVCSCQSPIDTQVECHVVWSWEDGQGRNSSRSAGWEWDVVSRDVGPEAGGDVGMGDPVGKPPVVDVARGYTRYT